MSKTKNLNSAHRVAIARAVHQLLDEPQVLDDPLSLSLLGPELEAAVRADPFCYNDPSARSMRAGVVARTLLAEQYLEAAIARGVQQVVVIGAGLDSFSLRQCRQLREIEFFEIDKAEMLAHKQRLAAQVGCHGSSNLHFVRADLQWDSWRNALIAGGFDPQAPAAISLLGVTPYLQPAQVRALLSDVTDMAPGSGIVFDYRVSTVLLNPIEQAIVAFSEQMFEQMGEPWLSQFDPQVLSKELNEMGLSVQNYDGTMLNQRYFSKRKDGLQIAGGGFHYVIAERVDELGECWNESDGPGR